MLGPSNWNQVYHQLNAWTILSWADSAWSYFGQEYIDSSVRPADCTSNLRPSYALFESTSVHITQSFLSGDR